MGLDGARVVRHPVKGSCDVTMFSSACWINSYAVNCGSAGVFICSFVARRPGAADSRPEADAQVIALVRQQLGLDQPLHVQFWHYITHVLQGDFGTSMVSRRPVSERSPAAFADAVADDNQYDMGGAVWHGDRHRRRRVA